MGIKPTSRPAPVADSAHDQAVVVTDENFEALLLESAGQALAIAQGTAAPARQSTRTRTAREAHTQPPAAYDAERVKKLRRQLRLSQPVFAGALNVSAATVQAWERGVRTPEGPSRRLLEVAERYPDAVLGTIRTR